MIYFIQDSGNTFIKIGYTASVAESRQKAGETWCPYGLVVLTTMPGDKRREAELHARFAEARINPEHEWFRPTPDLLRFIMRQYEYSAYLRRIVHARQLAEQQDKEAFYGLPAMPMMWRIHSLGGAAFG
jgi:hypothetical protein